MTTARPSRSSSRKKTLCFDPGTQSHANKHTNNRHGSIQAIAQNGDIVQLFGGDQTALETVNVSQYRVVR